MSTTFTAPFRLSPILMIVSLGLLSACGSNSASDSASALGGRGRVKVPPAKITDPSTTGGSTTTTTTTPTPTSPAVSSSGYDGSSGAGVDANGFASLPLRSGAQRYFVSSASGSDGNGCAGAQRPSTPLRSIAAAVTCVQDGNGDQILVAQGQSYAERLPTLWSKAGYSLIYPTVIQSYDPADPLNEASYGHAAGGSRPVLTGDMAGQNFIMGVKGQGFIALRGLDINPGNLSNQVVNMIDAGSGILIENNIFRYTELNFDKHISPIAAHWIVRNNAIYGGWNADMSTHAQGIYADGCDSMTIEDNVLWHNGWKVGATRDDPTGGTTIFRHAIYQQTSTDAITRRNLIVDGAADGGSHRGNSTITENVYIDNPIAIGAGGGPAYNTDRPNGVDLQVSYNAILGDADINSANPRGWGIATVNGQSGSSSHHNLIARSYKPSGNPGFDTVANFNQPSYMYYHDNVMYQWTSSPSSHVESGAYLSQVHPSFDNNIWDDPTFGTNRNVSSATFPNPYTLAQLYALLGFASKQSWIDYAITHPEEHPARAARTLLFAGYGLPSSLTAT
jgi:hypothetical protein